MFKKIIAWLKKLFGIEEEVKNQSQVSTTEPTKEQLRRVMVSAKEIQDDTIMKRWDSPDNYIGFTTADMANLDIAYVDADGNLLTDAQVKALKGKGYIPQFYLDRQARRGL